METNKRVRLSRAVGAYSDGIGVRDTALTMKKGEEGFLMDAYFPFDPYMLPRSKKWVQGDYNAWKSIPGMRDDDSGDDEEEDDDDDVEDDEDEDDDDDDGDDDDGDSADEESDSQVRVGNGDEEEEIDDGTGTDASS